jgi:hypothetical protein
MKGEMKMSESATPKQLWTLFTMAKKDYRDSGLSKENASEMISKLFEEKKGRSQKNLDIFNEAVEAGKAAMDNCVPRPMVVEQHTNMLNDNSPVKKAWCVPDGVCGFAWISLKANTPSNRSFLNDMKRAGFLGEHGKFSKSYNGGYQYWVSEGGQSMQKKEAYAHAFADVLRKNGITAYASSRMD